MIQLRIGQLWEREPLGIPLDSVGIQVEGVELLPGASEEHLTSTVPALVEAVHALVVSGQRQAQVSLSVAHLELLLARVEDDITLEVVRLARPALRLRAPLALEAEALAQAVVGAARTFHERLRELLPELAKAPELRRMGRQLEALSGSRRKAAAPRAPRTGPTLNVPPAELPGFTVTLEDSEGRLSTWRKGGKTPLATLLVQGTLSFCVGEASAPLWSAPGIPYLQVLELVREAEDLQRAMDLGEPRFELGGASKPLLIYTASDRRLTVGDAGGAVEIDARELARAMFTVGQDLVVRVVERYPSQASNPYLRELSIRCVAGLAQLRKATPEAEMRPPAAATSDASGERPASAARPSLAVASDADAAPTPVIPDGDAQDLSQLRAVRFESRFRWSSDTAEPPLHLLVRDEGPLLVAPHRLVQLDHEGRETAVIEAEHGVAALEDGRALVADGPYVQLRRPGEDSARWFQSHDALPLGPELWSLERKLLTLSEGRTLLAYDAVTGRELWRMAIPKTVRVHTAVHGELVVLTTDSGVLLGLNAADGQRRFQLRSRMGFPGPAQFHDDAMLVTLHDGSESAVVVADTASGSVAWMKEGLGLQQPTVPATDGTRVFLAGRRNGEARVVALAGGEEVFNRAVPLGAAPYSLRPYRDGVIAMSADGIAVRLDAAGTLLWRAGSPGEPQPRPLAPLLHRGLVVLPGRTVRVIESEGGRLLGELSTGAPLVDFALSRDLELYLLDEEGGLSCHQLLSHLSLLESAAEG